jgi:ribonuclease P protein component
LTYCQRLHNPGEFERVYAARKAVHASEMVVFVCPNDLGHSRLGVSVGCKHGNAVRRNRIKRVFRAAFRQSRDALPTGNDYVLVPRKGVKAFTTVAVSAALKRAAAKLAALAGRR